MAGDESDADWLRQVAESNLIDEDHPRMERIATQLEADSDRLARIAALCNAYSNTAPLHKAPGARETVIAIAEVLGVPF